MRTDTDEDDMVRQRLFDCLRALDRNSCGPWTSAIGWRCVTVRIRDFNAAGTDQEPKTFRNDRLQVDFLRRQFVCLLVAGLFITWRMFPMSPAMINFLLE